MAKSDTTMHDLPTRRVLDVFFFSHPPMEYSYSKKDEASRSTAVRRQL